ncbi:MAG TPA: type II toxin-antitoxin system VapC family toxin [Chloroflexota bacterium]|nr:type II toxin-antitoxin system VapC family toxin [Chloroflexota bacterium]
MTLYVVDASVLVRRILPNQPLGDKALRFFSQQDDESALELAAPDLIYVECASALWKYARFANLDAHAAALHLGQVFQLPILTTPTPLLVDRALALGLARGMSVYDACYVALAESLGCALVTADERLVRQAGGGRAKVEWLGDL